VIGADGILRGDTAMKLARRHILQLGGAAAAAMALPGSASALDYPVRPVRLIVGFPPGGPSDILGRLIAQWLSERLGQPFVVENQPGAASNLATAAVVRAPPDGYTLLLVGPANAINASLDDKLAFNFLRDIAPVAGVTREPLVMLVHPSVPARTGAELIAYAKSNPGRLKLALTDPGSAPHASGELFRMMTGVELALVRYTGGGPAALKGTIEGQSDLMFEPLSASVAPLRAGQLRALAVTAATRSPALPDLPVIGDFVPGYEASAVSGIGVPRDTPAEIIEKLNVAVNAAFADAKMQARLADTGGSPLAGSPADFGILMAQETDKWAKVVKFSAAGAR
jgi:tripartite-type tricarboxylate transporter receptor subunit TctC